MAGLLARLTEGENYVGIPCGNVVTGGTDENPSYRAVTIRVSRRIMDGIENLRTFVAVADAGSLAAAARRLDIVASVVTKRIDQLESRVCARLFKRSTKRVMLTEFGAHYLPQARRLIFDYDEVFAEMSHSPRQVEGHIRIRVPTPMAIGFMAQALAKFQRQHPRVSLDVVLQDRGVLSPGPEGFDIAITGSARSFA